MSDNDFDQMCDQNERDFKNSTELDQLRAENARLREQVEGQTEELRDCHMLIQTIADAPLQRDLLKAQLAAAQERIAYLEAQLQIDINVGQRQCELLRDAQERIGVLEGAAKDVLEYGGFTKPYPFDKLPRVIQGERAKCRNQDNRDYWTFLESKFNTLLALAAPAESGPNTEEQR